VSFQARLGRVYAVLCLVALQSILAAAQAPANSDPTYQQLRSIGLGAEAVTVNNVDLKRDAATFHLRSGQICFVTAVQGKVTGAVFVGDGVLILGPPLGVERASLKLLTKEDDFSESFNKMVLRFTDNTYDELKKAGSSASAGCDPGVLHDSQEAMRHNHMLKWNLEARLLQDVLGTQPGGFFMAFVHGKKYNDKEIFAIDPHGAPGLIHSVAPEEVEFLTYDENKLGTWAAFHLSSEYKAGTATGSQKNSVIQIEHQQLDTDIEKSANLKGKAATTFVAKSSGLRVIPLALQGTLRVQGVTGADGQALPFIQEDKHDDSDYSVILPKALAAGDRYTISTTYSGKEAVSNEGGGNYFPIARDNWYPNAANSAFGEFTTYDMTFHIPKGMKMAATGTMVSESNDSGQNVTTWKSEAPQTVAGFNFGRFKMEQVKIPNPEFLVQSFANEEPPSWVSGLQHAVNQDLPTESQRGLPQVALGNMNTTQLLKKALADGQVSVELYNNFFGPPLFKRVAMTQQTSCGFGQSWPELVWIPMCYFFDTTVRHSLGLDFGDRGYWKIVTPHEVAHQWWGHTVGFGSYRDQWMSEGFSDLSASLFVQLVEKNPKKFNEFWNDERELLLEKDRMGFRAIDAGPVTMGYRMSNSRTGGDLTRRLIYPKGAYILHMIRMMMWDRKTGDQDFKAAMHDFVSTYSGKAATTEDFKAEIEKHMNADMDLDGNHKMNWFFDEYVYGTGVPTYKFDYSFDKDSSGDVVFGLKVTQSNVDDSFRMIVPIYLELGDGKAVMLGRARMKGNTSVEQKVPMKGLKDKPRRAMINYYNDVLASN
jgi:hypothetical protein